MGPRIPANDARNKPRQRRLLLVIGPEETREMDREVAGLAEELAEADQRLAEQEGQRSGNDH